MLQYLQGLLGTQQQQSQNQFGQNLGLQNQELTQQGQQFDKNLGFQQQQLGQQGSEFARQQALAELEAQRQNALAQQDFGLRSQGQQFNQGESSRLNVTPGSTLWEQMQQLVRPVSGISANYRTGSPAASVQPRLNGHTSVDFVPASQQWRSIF